MVKAGNGNIDIKVINKYMYACVGVYSSSVSLTIFY